MKEINENLIYKQFKGYTKHCMEEVFTRLLKKKENEEIKEKKEREVAFKKAIDKIFELCPTCALIPVAVETTNGCEYITTNDFDTVYENVKYMERDFNVPTPDDNMTIGTWKELVKEWEIACNNSPILIEANKGDYCEFYHVSMYCFNKDTGVVEYYDDVNN